MDVVDCSRAPIPEPLLNEEREFLLASPLRERMAPMGADSGLGTSDEQDRRSVSPLQETPATGDNSDSGQNRSSVGIARFQGFPLNLEPTSSSGTRRPLAISEEERFQQTTHQLVHLFISRSLRRQGFIAPGYERQPSGPGMSAERTGAASGQFAAEDRLEKTEEALAALVEDFEHRFWQRFQRMLPNDWIEPNDMESMKNKYLTVSRDLHFKVNGKTSDSIGSPVNGGTSINWGRIVAHFSFTLHLASEAAAGGRYHLVEALVDWLSQFLTRFLRPWIQRNGGWEGLLVYRDECTLQKKWVDVAGNWAKGVGAGLILGAFGLLVAKRYLTQ